MGIARLYDFANGTTADAEEVDAELNQIIDAGMALISPANAALDLNGNALQNLAAGTAADPGLYFSSDANTGLYRVSADVVGVAAGGNEGLTVTGVASAVNYLALSNSATGNPLTLTATGDDTDIGVTLAAKGAGTVTVTTTGDVNASAARSLLISDGTVSNPGVAFDADTGLYSSADNTVDVAVGGVRGLQVSTVASAVNYLDLAPSATGDALTVTAEGTDTDVSINLVPKGTGSLLVNGAVLGVSMGGTGLTTSPGCHVTKSANQSITEDIETAVTWNQETYDTDTMHDTVTDNSRVTFTTGGVYTVTAQVVWASDATGARAAILRKGGSTRLAYAYNDGATINAGYVNVTYTGKFAAAEYVECTVLQSTAGALNLLATEAGTGLVSYLSAQYVGPGA